MSVKRLPIVHLNDFEFTAAAPAGAWDALPWQELSEMGGRRAGYKTSFKAAWSERGIYTLIDCEDQLLSCTDLDDFDDLYREDVAEIFLWPDEGRPLYLEYEISPLGKELVLLVPNAEGAFMGWQPWHYEGERRVRKAIRVRGGPATGGAAIKGWQAEVFIPFQLMTGLRNVPPRAGTEWRANIYRLDYDEAPRAMWAWSPVSGATFHSPGEFGRWCFE